jgi:hypothetical protein
VRKARLLLPPIALDAVSGQDHALLLPDWGRDRAACGCAGRTTGVPVFARHRRDRLQPWLAAWFAAILVLAPCARPSLPPDLAAAPADAPEAPATHDGIEGEPPAAGLSSAQPVTLGILSRPSLVETTLGVPPVKSPVLGPAVHQPVLARAGAIVLADAPTAVFQRSAVGTARTPTGPPA